MGAVKEDEVKELLFPENADDEDIMIPVDMRGVGQDFDDPEAMAEKLGPKGTVEAFLKAKEYYEKNQNKIPEDERPTPMSVEAWKCVLADAGEEGEEELQEEGEEEEADEDEEEEDDGPEEPAAKKAKKAKKA